MDKPARWWIATHNNPEVSLSEHFDAIYDTISMRYIAGQTEIGKEGTKHFQYLICLTKPQRLSYMKKVDARAHWEIIRRVDAVQRYVSKSETSQGDYQIRGTMPVDRSDKVSWDNIWELAKVGKLEEIPADIRIRCYNQIRRIQQDHAPMQATQDTTKGLWIVGKSGCGKSSTARKLFPDAYIKNCNKWFDGYQGEDVIIMDDVDDGHSCLGHHLKLWSDHYGCRFEIKGGSVPSKHSKFVVTS